MKRILPGTAALLAVGSYFQKRSPHTAPQPHLSLLYLEAPPFSKVWREGLPEMGPQSKMQQRDT